MDPLGLLLTPSQEAAVAAISSVTGTLVAAVTLNPVAGGAAGAAAGVIATLAFPGHDSVDVGNAAIIGFIGGTGAALGAQAVEILSPLARVAASGAITAAIDGIGLDPDVKKPIKRDCEK